MLKTAKRYIKSLLRYQPLAETSGIRAIIDAAATNGLPYCPADEGDLLFSLIRSKGYSRCLETGFHTGSSALYMAAGVDAHDGSVISICIDDDESVNRGLDLVRAGGYENRHELIRANSNTALPELFLAGRRFDFIFMDGWKTFDHLAFEMYLFNQMLETGGVIAFDDAYMPSVRKAIGLLKSYYGYREIDYAAHNQNTRLRLHQILTTRSKNRPYRALEKTVDTARQSPFLELHFHQAF